MKNLKETIWIIVRNRDPKVSRELLDWNSLINVLFRNFSPYFKIILPYRYHINYANLLNLNSAIHYYILLH